MVFWTDVRIVELRDASNCEPINHWRKRKPFQLNNIEQMEPASMCNTKLPRTSRAGDLLTSCLFLATPDHFQVLHLLKLWRSVALIHFPCKLRHTIEWWFCTPFICNFSGEGNSGLVHTILRKKMHVKTKPVDPYHLCILNLQYKIMSYSYCSFLRVAFMCM